MKKTAQKLSDTEVINLFCGAIDGHPLAQPGASPSKYALFIGRNMFGKRTYDSPKAAAQAIVRLVPRIVATLSGQHLASTVSQVRRALKDNKLRQRAIAEAISRERFCIQRISSPLDKKP